MGARRKLLYRRGVLSDAITDEVIERFEVLKERLLPAEYRVELTIIGGTSVSILEDESGVWLEREGVRRCLTASQLALPRFEPHAHAAMLRVLHHEILINVVNGQPLPNFMVYDTPWYRDAATMAMVLEKTDNLSLIASWVDGLREPFDRNNAGHREPDNLGQALYLISLVADRSHPLVETVLVATTEFRRERHLVGLSDFAEHPVYQTKWLKFGLSRLGLEDDLEIPEVFDSYSSLFWWAYRDRHVPGPAFDEVTRDLYPYLAWAEAHFHGLELPLELAGRGYPLSWEAEASQAAYRGMARVDPEYTERRLCAPHTWHAGEMFLSLLERPGNPDNPSAKEA